MVKSKFEYCSLCKSMAGETFRLDFNYTQNYTCKETQVDISVSITNDPTTMKNKIIQIAKQRFFKEGLKKVHMDDIASDMGVSKKTLYKHFRSKEELAQAAVNLLQEEIRQALASFRKDTEDPIERFEKMVCFACKKLSEAGPLFLNDIKREMPDLWRSFEDFRHQEIMSHINDILSEGKKNKQIRLDIDTHIATLIYFGIIQTVIQPDVLEKNKINLEDAFTDIHKIFLDGVKTKTLEYQNVET